MRSTLFILQLAAPRSRVVAVAVLAALCFGWHPASAAAQESAKVGTPQTLTLQGQPTRTISGVDTTTPGSELVAGRRVERLSKVTEASVTWFPAAPTGRAGVPTVLVLPGGGYQVLATDLEGSEVCAWLNAQGISALLLRYRVPTEPPHAAPLADAQAALALLVSHATPWHVDAAHLGVIGFSAGAHLAGRLVASAPLGELKAMLLVYPAYYAAPVADVAPVPFAASTPPTFLVQAQDDPVGVSNATAVFAQLSKLQVPVELHIYAKGGHGYGLRPAPAAISHWPDLAAVWLARQGVAAGITASPADAASVAGLPAR